MIWEIVTAGAVLALLFGSVIGNIVEGIDDTLRNIESHRERERDNIEDRKPCKDQEKEDASSFIRKNTEAPKP